MGALIFLMNQKIDFSAGLVQVAYFLIPVITSSLNFMKKLNVSITRNFSNNFGIQLKYEGGNGFTRNQAEGGDKKLVTGKLKRTRETSFFIVFDWRLGMRKIFSIFHNRSAPTYSLRRSV